MYGFQNMLDFIFFVLYCICQYIDEVNEEYWQNMLIDINLCQYFINMLWINPRNTFILQNFGLKLGQYAPMT